MALDSHFRAFVNSTAENKVSRDVWKLLGFWIDFSCILDPQNEFKNQWKIDPRAHLGPRWLQGGVTLSQHGSKNRFLSDFLTKFCINLGCCPIDFGLIFFRSKNNLLLFLESILDHFRLMSDRFGIDIHSILTWIGLMFTRCWDRFSSDLNKSILTLIATRPPLGLAALASKSRWTPLLLTPVFVVHKRTNSITESAIHQS